MRMPKLNVSRIHSFISNGQGGGGFTTMNFTVPAGTVFRGVISGSARHGSVGSPYAIGCHIELVDGSSKTIWSQEGKSAVLTSNFDAVASAQTWIELQPGNYALSVTGKIQSSGMSILASIAGTCYYQDRA